MVDLSRGQGPTAFTLGAAFPNLMTDRCAWDYLFHGQVGLSKPVHCSLVQDLQEPFVWFLFKVGRHDKGVVKLVLSREQLQRASFRRYCSASPSPPLAFILSFQPCSELH